MKATREALLTPPSLPVRWLRALVDRHILEKPFGLKAKITFLIIFNVAGVLLLVSVLDYQLSKRDQIDLFLNRNLYIAKQSATDTQRPNSTASSPHQSFTVKEKQEEP